MISLILSLFLSLSAHADDSIPAGCTNAANFSAEAYKVWVSTHGEQKATEDFRDSKPIAVGEKTTVQLISGQPESHGYVSFEILSAGEYIIVSDAYPRMTVMDSAHSENMNPVDFGKVHDCGTVNKVLRFHFPKAGKYFLGFVNSKGATLNALVMAFK
jgi:hypothetical protein